MNVVKAIILAISVCVLASAEDGDVGQLLDRARAALRDREPERAVELAGRAIEAAKDDPRSYQLRADIRAALGEHEAAIPDYDQAIKLAPDQPELYDRRGSERFKLGKFDDSIADFDRYLALRPDQEKAHWKRGISYYYAGRFADGRKQFEGYQTVDDNDVENAVWRYLCMARGEGLAKARAEILSIKRDGRVPMMEVYALYRGDISPDEVLRAARDGDPPPDRLNERLFYAHLYLALYFEATGDTESCAEHIVEAEMHRIPHYMWDVARVHAARIRAVQRP
ncbi:MAG TPA: tetratricopeptide repeat protein [Pirellulales bacterium]|jgi:lipoprotein NlpI